MNGNDLFRGIIIGIVVGIATGILVAPKSGKETREQISSTMLKMKGDFAEKFDKTKDISKEAYDKIIEEVVSTYEQNKEITKDQAKKIRAILTNAAKDFKA